MSCHSELDITIATTCERSSNALNNNLTDCVGTSVDDDHNLEIYEGASYGMAVPTGTRTRTVRESGGYSTMEER